MNNFKDMCISSLGVVSGTVAMTAVSEALQVVSALFTIFLGAVTLIRAIIGTVDAVRKHARGEATAEETDEKLKQIEENLKGGKDNDAQ